MNFNLKIIEIKSITEIPGYWANEDYMNLLEEFDYSDSKDLDPLELREILEMAISDFEPNESAEILLRYKLSEKLSKGQIQNLSNEMVEDNESEENADIALHFPLFNINELLYKSYNGIFPKAKATKMEIQFDFLDNANIAVTKELVLCMIGKLLRKENLIIRMYAEELSGKKRFEDAEKIIWTLEKNANGYTLITSDYWINKEDLIEDEISSTLMLFED